LFNRRLDAEPLERRLREDGIQAETLDRKQLKGVELDVPAGQFEQAHRDLMAWDAAEGVLREAIRCPECRSLRVEYPQYSRKSILPNLLIGFMTLIGATKKEFYCQDCHFTWPKAGLRPSRSRPHSAPYYFIDGIEQTTLRRRSPTAEATRGS